MARHAMAIAREASRRGSRADLTATGQVSNGIALPWGKLHPREYHSPDYR